MFTTIKKHENMKKKQSFESYKTLYGIFLAFLHKLIGIWNIFIR